MVLPLLKLGLLAFRTLSKPIASRLKQQAGNYPKFRELIIDLAQANHRLTTNIQRRLYGQATDVKIRPLNEERAVQSAVDLFGEVFVFSVAGAAIIFEVQRSARSEARKEEMRREELEALKQQEEVLTKEVEELTEKLKVLEHLARGRGLLSIFGVTQGQETQSSKQMSVA
ncbi:OPA3-like protein [Curcuma longa]|uniref:OPA3-like protein n=1 Tax=Curcuma longa TaxID=136217 RepID=UPI003D9E5D6E